MYDQIGQLTMMYTILTILCIYLTYMVMIYCCAWITVTFIKYKTRIRIHEMYKEKKEKKK